MPLPDLAEFQDFHASKNGKPYGTILEDDGRITTRWLPQPKTVDIGDLERRLGKDKARDYFLLLAWCAGWREAQELARLDRLMTGIRLARRCHLTPGQAAEAVGLTLDHFRRELKRTLGPRWRLAFQPGNIGAHIQAMRILEDLKEELGNEAT